MKTIGHLEEIGSSYYVHWIHSMEVFKYLMFCCFTSIICSVLPNTFPLLIEKRRRVVNKMYLDLMSRWYHAANIATDREIKKQRLKKIQVLENIETDNKKLEVPKEGYFYNLKQELDNSKKYFLCATSSLVHGFFPEILVDHAACMLIEIYLKMYYSK